MNIRRTILALACAISLAGPACAQVSAPDPVASEAAHSRFILIEGGRNFRDVGGYETADGHIVRPGVLYRSGSLGSLALAGQLKLSSLGIGSIVDLRTTEERGRDVSNWPSMAVPRYWARDYSLSLGDLVTVFADPGKQSAEGVSAMMAQSYRGLPREMAQGYRELFARLIEGKGATIVNCTAGKDRTGIGTALVLTALGVPYETVRQDFLLSNNAPGMKTIGGTVPAAMRAIPPDVQRVLGGVDGSWLDAAFDQIGKDYGSVEGFLGRELGVGPDETAALKARMLE